MLDFYDLSLDDTEALCARGSYSLQHAKTLYRSAYKSLSKEPWQAESLPKDLALELSQTYFCDNVQIHRESLSRYDGTVKFLVRLQDGSLIESVLMPEKQRITLCVSTQVGCAQACSFCHTGRMGLKRNLSAGEIVAQVVLARRWVNEHPSWREDRGYAETMNVSNLVFMGMGEPLDNVEAVKKCLRILCEPLGLNLALRKISVSTAGHLDGLKSLLQDFPQVALALSLHATTDRERSQLMPINRRWPIAEVLDYLRGFYRNQDGDRSVLIQYTVIHGVNDKPEQAQRMVDMLADLPVKVNLIPLNVVGPSRFKGPEPDALERFRDLLHAAGIRVMVRYSKGQDIDAACGQLVVNEEMAAANP